MKATYSLNKKQVKHLDATLTVTMTVAQWEILTENLSKANYNHTVATFNTKVRRLVEKAHQEFFVVEVEDETQS